MNEIELIDLIGEVKEQVDEAKRIYRKAIRNLGDIEERLDRLISKIA